MADVKISALPTNSALDGSETLPIVQSTTTKKVAAKDVAKFGYQDIITDATAAKTLALTDIGGWIRFTSASAVTLTIPTNATVAFGVGTTLNGIQAGDGLVTIAAASGVTLNKPAGYNAKTRAKGSAWCLVKVATDTWDLLGDLEVTA
jgi:hypothetical protein